MSILQSYLGTEIWGFRNCYDDFYMELMGRQLHGTVGPGRKNRERYRVKVFFYFVLVCFFSLFLLCTERVTLSKT